MIASCENHTHEVGIEKGHFKGLRQSLRCSVREANAVVHVDEQTNFKIA